MKRQGILVGKFEFNFEHLPLKAVSQSVPPCQVSYSLNSDPGTEYLIAAMLYIE